MRTDKEIKQAVIAILTCARDGAGADGNPAGAQALVNGTGRNSAESVARQLLTAAVYALSLFHMLAAEFEAACPDADVQAFLRRRALELAADDEEVA